MWSHRLMIALCVPQGYWTRCRQTHTTGKGKKWQKPARVRPKFFFRFFVFANYKMRKLHVSQNCIKSNWVIFCWQSFWPHGFSSGSPRTYEMICSSIVGMENCAEPGDGIPFWLRTNSYSA